MKGEAEETQGGKEPALSLSTGPCSRGRLTFTLTPLTPDPQPTHSPHVDKASAQERVKVPVYVGQAGDVEDLVAHACREQEEDVKEAVPHLVPRPGAALCTHTHRQK